MRLKDILGQHDGIIRQQQLIAEGMIKLPKEMLDKIWDFVNATTLKWCAAGLEHVETASEMEQHKALSLLDKAAGSNIDVEDYSSSILHSDAQSKSFKLEIPERYLDRYQQLRGDRETNLLQNRNITVNVVVNNPSKFDMTRGESGLYRAEDHSINLQPEALDISAKSVITLVAHHKNDVAAQLKTLTIMFKQLKATIEHELTHGLQLLVFGELHSDQFQTATPDAAVEKGSEEAKDIYYMQQVEFDPWIKTETARIKGLIHAGNLDQAKQDELFRKFTCSDLSTAQAHKTKITNRDHSRSGFFLALKRHDQLKWRKAVKLLSQNL